MQISIEKTIFTNCQKSRPLTNSFTKIAEDWELFLKIECKDIFEARKIERHIKKMKSKKYLENLKKYPEIIKKLKEK